VAKKRKIQALDPTELDELFMLYEIAAERNAISLDEEGFGADIASLYGEFSGHPFQQKLWEDPSKLIAVLGSRRGAKTSTILRLYAGEASRTPDSFYCYINTTKEEAWRVAWRGANPRDGLSALNERFGLGATPRLGDLTLTFPNGSLIQLLGADNPRAFQKALGMAPRRVWIDEAQKMRSIQEAVEETLGPGMMDFDGSIIMSGTCVNDVKDYFYEVTRPGSPLQKSETNPHGWSMHYASCFDNPAFGKTYEERYQNTVVDYCRKFNLDISHPRVRRLFFMEWVAEDAEYVYEVNKVSPDVLFWADAEWETIEMPLPEGGSMIMEWPNFQAAIEKLPRRPDGKFKDWRIGVSADLGYEPDPFALTVAAWSPEDPDFYELGAVKKNLLIPDQQAFLLRMVYDQLHPTYMVGDAGGSNAVVKGWERGWQDRHPLPIQAAEKSNKAVHQEFLNNDIRTGRVRLLRGSPLYTEMSELLWVTAPSGKRFENVARGKGGVKRHPNDLGDSLLYNHRESRHHRYQEPAKKPKPGTHEFELAEQAQFDAEAMAQFEEQDNDHWN
jgi:hypothetical protein